jgi:hypothetical protein
MPSGDFPILRARSELPSNPREGPVQDTPSQVSAHILVARARLRIRRPFFNTIAFLSVAALAYVAGIGSTRHLPQVTSPVYDASRAIVDAPRGWLSGVATFFQPGGPVPTAEAMGANSFVVTQNVPNLDGKILFGLRGFLPGYRNRIVEVDRSGRVLWEHAVDDASLTDVRALPNGNVLFNLSGIRFEGGRIIVDTSQVVSWVQEVDRSGAVVRKQRLPATHHAELLPNGNLLLVDYARNMASEMDWSGQTVWRWKADERILPYTPKTYVGLGIGRFPEIYLGNMYAHHREGPDDWTHINGAQRLPNGNTVLSLRNLDLVVEVDPRGEVVWTFGALVIKHQHCAWVLDNGNLLVTDNGNARVIEVDRASQRIVWEFREGLLMPAQACAYRLPSGNTLITDSQNLRVLEVTPDKRIAWELVVKTPATVPLYRAWWSPQ